MCRRINGYYRNASKDLKQQESTIKNKNLPKIIQGVVNICKSPQLQILGSNSIKRPHPFTSQSSILFSKQEMQWYKQRHINRKGKRKRQMDGLHIFLFEFPNQLNLLIVCDPCMIIPYTLCGSSNNIEEENVLPPFKLDKLSHEIYRHFL